MEAHHYGMEVMSVEEHASVSREQARQAKEFPDTQVMLSKH